MSKNAISFGSANNSGSQGVNGSYEDYASNGCWDYASNSNNEAYLKNVDHSSTEDLSIVDDNSVKILKCNKRKQSPDSLVHIEKLTVNVPKIEFHFH